MSATPGRDLASAQNALDAAHKYFDPQLSTIGLSVDQIQQQTLEELEASLVRVNEAIQHPESFGSLRIKITTGIIVASAESHIEVGILPILLERKSLVLRRIGLLRPQEQLNDLRDVVVKTVEDPQARKSLLDSIEESVAEALSQADALQRQAEQTDEQRERLMLLQVELQERRSAIYRSFLERESVASVVGALLLLALGLAVIVAMFTHTTTTEVVTNSFLLVLGYFFGQAVTRQVKEQRGERQRRPQGSRDDGSVET